MKKIGLLYILSTLFVTLSAMKQKHDTINSSDFVFSPKEQFEEKAQWLLEHVEFEKKDTYDLILWFAVGKRSIDINKLIIIKKGNEVPLESATHLLNWAVSNGHDEVAALILTNIALAPEDMRSVRNIALEKGLHDIVDSIDELLDRST